MQCETCLYGKVRNDKITCTFDSQTAKLMMGNDSCNHYFEFIFDEEKNDG